MKSLINIALFFLLQTAFAFANNAPCKNVDLPSGTLVILELNEKISTSSATIGKMLQMRVRTHVVVNGEVVIRTGCQAIGRVKNISKGAYSTAESITIELFYVMSVDGQQIALNGNEQTIEAQMTNEPAVAQINTLITAQVMNNETIDVK